MYKAINKTKAIWSYMGLLAIHTSAPTIHWEENTSFIYVVESRIITPIFKHIEIPVCFLKFVLIMVSLFQNMRSIMLCWKICAPNHVHI